LARGLDSRTPVRLVSFSVDPERDTPEKLAEYAAAYEAEPDRWLFLTGDKKQVRRLVSEGFHLSVEDASPEDIAAGAEPVLHSTRFVLVDAHGRIRGYYNGLDDEAMSQLGRDIVALHAEPGP
jgi:cytochrome oxidase Cu insertion factor (SCO1/SenC/PrrC family)